MGAPQANNTETIAALATAPGRGGIGIIRVSGILASKIAETVLGKVPPPRMAEHLPYLDESGEVLDIGLALYFPAPNSFTGEDVLELQGHGGPVVLDLLLKRVYGLGARPARPGEFSERAFLNNKMDLTQAEAISDLIDCASEQAARLAVRSLQGEFSKQVHVLVGLITELRVYVESAIDFPEEEIDFLADGQVQSQLANVQQVLRETEQAAHQGNLLREGMTVVIAGRPNAGKSTLLNALAGRETAIVTSVPGTTRDILREHIQIDGLPLHIIDTAGLRESEDPVEQEGVRRAWKEIESADRILLLHDATQAFDDKEEVLRESLLQAGPPMTLVMNKVDLVDNVKLDSKQANIDSELVESRVSAQTGEGLEQLKDHLKQCVGYQSGGEGQFMARRRHLEALKQASQHLEQGAKQLKEFSAGEILAEELRLAQRVLGEITGEVTADDLLGEIFSSFCIGK